MLLHKRHDKSGDNIMARQRNFRAFWVMLRGEGTMVGMRGGRQGI